GVLRQVREGDRHRGACARRRRIQVLAQETQARSGCHGDAARCDERRGAREAAVGRERRLSMGKVLLGLLAAGKLGKVALTGGTMLLSVIAYAFIFGWWYAVGFVALIFVHE